MVDELLALDPRELASVALGEEILDAGRTARTLTAAQLRAIIARDGHCIWTGCDAAPGWCDGHRRSLRAICQRVVAL